MKKSFCLLVVASFLLVHLFSQSSDKVHNLVFVKEVTGKVEIRSPGSGWQSAAPGMGIQKDGEISTGFKSMAVVVIGNSVVTVKPLTRLSLSEITSNGVQEKVNLNMPTGRIQADVKPPSAGKVDFTVKSPEVTASVLGTQYSFDGFNLDVLEGAVTLSSPQTGLQSDVHQGESSSGSPDDILKGGAGNVLAQTDTPTPAGLPLTPASILTLPNTVTGKINIVVDFE